MATNLIQPTEAALTNLWTSIQGFFPNLIGALLVLIVGIPISNFMQKVVSKLLTKARLDDWARKNGLEKALFHTSLTDILAAFTKWVLLLIFFTQASTTLGLTTLTDFLVGFLQAIPNIIVGALIVVISLTLGDFFERSVKSKAFAFSEIFAAGVYFLTVYFGIVLALPKFGITNVEILVNGFNYIIAGISVGIAIALGLGVGLALKDPIAKLITKGSKKRR